jgi:hypothetical protein
MLIALLLAGTAHGFRAPDQPAPAAFDTRKTAVAPVRVNGSRAKAAARLREKLPGTAPAFDSVTEAPRFIRARDGFLTGPDGEGRGVSAAVARGFAPKDPHRAIKAFLSEHRALFGHGPEALDGARKSRDASDANGGFRTTVWQQQLDGIDIFDAVLTGHVTRRGELVNLGSQFVSAPAAARGARAAQPDVSAVEAVAAALRELGAPADEITVDVPAAGVERRQSLRGPGLKGRAGARLIWLPLKGDELTLCWQVEFTTRRHGEMFRSLVDAQTGAVLLRRNLTVYLTNATFRVFTGDSPTPFSPGHSSPSSVQPPVAARTLVTWAAFDTNASPGGWIDAAVNETRGNNVDAHTDLTDDDAPDLPRPQGSPHHVFDFAMDLAQPPSAYRSAAVVQLFYTCNWVHDRLWQLGFTEASGNFQTTNFNRGGLGDDALLADAQDGGDFNNANMSTPGDGFPPRMQMYVFNGPSPDIDGDFDVEVVVHEYVHGLTERLVGGGVGIFSAQTAGMGEGWSDWYALTLLGESGDDPGGCTAMGAYATRQFFGLQENYYFGIRRYPYSTNLLKNPLTFKDIDPSQFSHHPGIPRSPVVGGGGADEVHNQGEVWCAMLWELRANLIARHGFATGNELALQLVTDGLKLSPGNPNFIEARDAILQADLVLTGGANQSELWRAFAKRGMGFTASSPPSYSSTGVRESYDLPDTLLITPGAGIAAAGLVAGPFAPTNSVFLLTNSGSNTLAWTARSAGLFGLSLHGGTLVPGATAAVTAVLSSAAAALPVGDYADAVVFSNATSGVTQQRDMTLTVGGFAALTEMFDSASFDLAGGTLTFTPDGSARFYNVCRAAAASFPTDPSGGVTLSLTDDSFSGVALNSGALVSLYGVSYGTLYIVSNGRVTFGSGDNSYEENPGSHFARPGVSALFDDLNPATGGTISYRQLADRFAVTWQNVPEYDETTANSFQIELFFNGVIRITHLGIAAQDGLVGLSAGAGMPGAFLEGDFSAEGACVPALRVALPAGVTEGDGLLPAAGTVSLAQPGGADVFVSFASSDPLSLGVSANVTIPAGQTNASFALFAADDALLDGSRFVRINAFAAGHQNGGAIIAVHDNETAQLQLALPSTVREGDGLLAAAGTVNISAPPDSDVVVQLASLTTNELDVPIPAFAILPAGQTNAPFSLNVIDDVIPDGPQTATLIAQVVNWAAATNSLTVLDNETTALMPSLNGGVLQLAWPGSYASFALEAATNLAPPVAWNAATNSAVLTNDQWRVQLDPSAPQRFFRLRAP